MDLATARRCIDACVKYLHDKDDSPRAAKDLREAVNLMSREYITLAMVHEAFVAYLSSVRGDVIAKTADQEWHKFKSLLLTRMQTESVKKNG
jgi:hypothetical protein